MGNVQKQAFHLVFSHDGQFCCRGDYNHPRTADTEKQLL